MNVKQNLNWCGDRRLNATDRQTDRQTDSTDVAICRRWYSWQAAIYRHSTLGRAAAVIAVSH